jgi:hypothetical protein
MKKTKTVKSFSELSSAIPPEDYLLKSSIDLEDVEQVVGLLQTRCSANLDYSIPAPGSDSKKIKPTLVLTFDFEARKKKRRGRRKSISPFRGTHVSLSVESVLPALTSRRSRSKRWLVLVLSQVPALIARLRKSGVHISQKDLKASCDVLLSSSRAASTK